MGTCLRCFAVILISPGGYLLVGPQNTLTDGGAGRVSTLLRTADTP